jgi:heptosyltransferase-3
MTRPQTTPAPAERIAFLHAGTLGDCILTLHVIRAITRALNATSDGGEECPVYNTSERPADTKKRHKDDTRELALIARSPIRTLAVSAGLVTESLDIEAAGFHTLFAPAGPIATHIRHLFERCDLLVSFCGGPDSVLIQRLRTITQARIVAVEPQPRAETLTAGRHITDQFCCDLRAAGVPVAEISPEPLFAVKPAAPAAPLAAKPATSPRPIVVHPGSGGRRKCWPLHKFERVVRTLRSEGRDVRWLIGDVEVETHGEALRTRLSGTADVLIEPDPARLAEQLAGAAAYLGNDAGPSHLAAAVGTPTVALFGPTDPAVWGPIGPAVVTLRGSGERADPFGGLSVERVVAAVRAGMRAG